MRLHIYYTRMRICAARSKHYLLYITVPHTPNSIYFLTAMILPFSRLTDRYARSDMM